MEKRMGGRLGEVAGCQAWSTPLINARQVGRQASHGSCAGRMAPVIARSAVRGVGRKRDSAAAGLGLRSSRVGRGIVQARDDGGRGRATTQICRCCGRRTESYTTTMNRRLTPSRRADALRGRMTPIRGHREVLIRRRRGPQTAKDLAARPHSRRPLRSMHREGRPSSMGRGQGRRHQAVTASTAR